MVKEPSTTDIDLDAPLILVSADSHIGPRLKEDLREYCPKKYLEDYDDYIRAYQPNSDPSQINNMFLAESTEAESEPATNKSGMTNDTPGHYDVYRRLKDMDREGVAAEVIYHGSQNGQPFPFLPTLGGTFNALVFSPGSCSPHELQLAAVGQRMYNRWLADQCSVEPERHAGLAHVPMWDVDAAVQEVEWASSVGLRGVNFPAPKLGVRLYDDPAWEPFWAECEQRGMVLSTHAGSDIESFGDARPHTLIVLDLYEVPEKVLPRMVFSGVFERYPALKYAITELQRPYSRWWVNMNAYFDDIWEANRDLLDSQLPRRPSEYLGENVYHGTSLFFLAPEEVDIAVRDGYASHVMWGHDYPHGEGPYRIPKDDEEETRTMLALRNAFSGVTPELAKRMVGATAVEVHGLDSGKLTLVAERIKAMTLRQLGTPLDTVPDEWEALAKMTLPFPEYRRPTHAR